MPVPRPPSDVSDGRGDPALSGIGLLLDPACRQDLRDGIVACGPRCRRRLGDVLPPTWRIPEERDAFLRALAAGDDVLLLRRPASRFDVPWRIVSVQELDPETVAVARPLCRRAGDGIVEQVVRLHALLPLRADVRADDPVPPHAVAAVDDATRALLAAAREHLHGDPSPDGAVRLIFQWTVREDGTVELLDVRRGPPPDEAQEGDGDWRTLWPDTEDPRALAFFPAPRPEDADAAGVAIPADLADVVWRMQPCEVGTLDGLPVLYDARRERLVPLDAVGAYVWLRSRDGETPRAIAHEIAAAYGAEPTAVARDVWGLLATWTGAGLAAHPVDTAAPAAAKREPVTPPPRDRDLVQRVGVGVGRVDLAGADARVWAPLAALGDAWLVETRSATPGPRVAVAPAAEGYLRIRDGTEEETLPGPTWLAPELFARLTLHAAWPDAPAVALCAGLVDGVGGLRLVVAPDGDRLAAVLARLLAGGATLLAAPYVPLDETGCPHGVFPGGLAVPETGRPGALAGLPAWRAARPLPRPVGGPVRLIPFDAPPASSRLGRPAAILFLEPGDGGTSVGTGLEGVAALRLLVEYGLPGRRRLTPAAARAFVAVLDGTPRSIVRSPDVEALARRILGILGREPLA